MSPAIGDTWNVTIVCSAGTQVSQNVKQLHVASLAGSGLNGPDFADAISTSLSSYFKSILNVGAKFEGVKVQRLFPNPGQPIVSTASNGVGLVSGDLAPPQTAGLVKLQTGASGRRGRGRIYLPFPSESDSTSAGKPSATYLNNIDGIGQYFTSSATFGTGGNTVSVIWCMDKAPFNGTTLRPFVTYVVRANWATQRRRSFINRADYNPLA